jgi:hypothetical protein
LMKQLRLLVCNSQPFLYVRLCDFFFSRRFVIDSAISDTVQYSFLGGSTA